VVAENAGGDSPAPPGVPGHDACPPLAAPAK